MKKIISVVVLIFIILSVSIGLVACNKEPTQSMSFNDEIELQNFVHSTDKLASSTAYFLPAPSVAGYTCTDTSYLFRYDEAKSGFVNTRVEYTASVSGIYLDGNGMRVAENATGGGTVSIKFVSYVTKSDVHAPKYSHYTYATNAKVFDGNDGYDKAVVVRVGNTVVGKLFYSTDLQFSNLWIEGFISSGWHIVKPDGVTMDAGKCQFAFDSFAEYQNFYNLFTLHNTERYLAVDLATICDEATYAFKDDALVSGWRVLNKVYNASFAKPSLEVHFVKATGAKRIDGTAIFHDVSGVELSGETRVVFIESNYEVPNGETLVYGVYCGETLVCDLQLKTSLTDNELNDFLNLVKDAFKF